MAQPPSLFFWNWGTPLSTATSVSGLAVPGTALYRRDFVNGTILVNPNNSTATLPLGSTHYDCVHLDKSGNPTAVSTATVPAHDAAFLLNGR
jgi:hypothetical protein